MKRCHEGCVHRTEKERRRDVHCSCWGNEERKPDVSPCCLPNVRSKHLLLNHPFEERRKRTPPDGTLLPSRFPCLVRFLLLTATIFEHACTISFFIHSTTYLIIFMRVVVSHINLTHSQLLYLIFPPFPRFSIFSFFVEIPTTLNKKTRTIYCAKKKVKKQKAESRLTLVERGPSLSQFLRVVTFFFPPSQKHSLVPQPTPHTLHFVVVVPYFAN